jgi:hypothetical protein
MALGVVSGLMVRACRYGIHSLSQLLGGDSLLARLLGTVYGDSFERPDEVSSYGATSFWKQILIIVVVLLYYIITDFVKISVPALIRLICKERFSGDSLLVIAGSTGSLTAAIMITYGVCYSDHSLDGLYFEVVWGPLPWWYFLICVSYLLVSEVSYCIIGAGFVLEGKAVLTVLGAGSLRTLISVLLLFAFWGLERSNLLEHVFDIKVYLVVAAILFCAISGFFLYVAILIIKRELKKEKLRKELMLSKSIHEAQQEAPQNSPYPIASAFLVIPGTMV